MDKSSLSFEEFQQLLENSKFTVSQYELIQEIAQKKIQSVESDKYLEKLKDVIEDLDHDEIIQGYRRRNQKPEEDLELKQTELNQFLENIHFLFAEHKKNGDIEKSGDRNPSEDFILQFSVNMYGIENTITTTFTWVHDYHREESNSSRKILLNGKNLYGHEDKLAAALHFKHLDVAHLVRLLNHFYGIFRCNLDIDWE